MDVIINTEPLFEDIRDSKARKKFDEMVGYFCCKLFSESRPKMIKIPAGSFEENNEYVANILYSKDNRILANDILKNRSEIIDNEDDELIVDRDAMIYELSSEKILRLYSAKYFESVSVCEHELIHLLQAINDNNPKV